MTARRRAIAAGQQVELAFEIRHEHLRIGLVGHVRVEGLCGRAVVDAHQRGGPFQAMQLRIDLRPACGSHRDRSARRVPIAAPIQRAGRSGRPRSRQFPGSKVRRDVPTRTIPRVPRRQQSPSAPARSSSGRPAANSSASPRRPGVTLRHGRMSLVDVPGRLAARRSGFAATRSIVMLPATDAGLHPAIALVEFPVLECRVRMERRRLHPDRCHAPPIGDADNVGARRLLIGQQQAAATRAIGSHLVRRANALHVLATMFAPHPAELCVPMC